jgi:hypothetical protein
VRWICQRCLDNWQNSQLPPEHTSPIKVTS